MPRGVGWGGRLVGLWTSKCNRLAGTTPPQSRNQSRPNAPTVCWLLVHPPTYTPSLPTPPQAGLHRSPAPWKSPNPLEPLHLHTNLALQSPNHERQQQQQQKTRLLRATARGRPRNAPATHPRTAHPILHRARGSSHPLRTCLPARQQRAFLLRQCPQRTYSGALCRLLGGALPLPRPAWPRYVRLDSTHPAIHLHLPIHQPGPTTPTQSPQDACPRLRSSTPTSKSRAKKPKRSVSQAVAGAMPG